MGQALSDSPIYMCSRDCAAAVTQMQTKLVSMDLRDYVVAELWIWYLYHRICSYILYFHQARHTHPTENLLQRVKVG